MYDLDADQARYRFQFYHVQPEILGKLFTALSGGFSANFADEYYEEEKEAERRKRKEKGVQAKG